MKISTKGRYGLRAIIDLGLHPEEAPISMGEIARRENISKEYLEQIFSSLRKAGLVRSVRGQKGGYILSVDLEEVTAGDVLRIMEGSLEPVNCADEKFDCEQEDECVTKEVWQNLSREIHNILDSYTLSDLFERGEELKL